MGVGKYTTKKNLSVGSAKEFKKNYIKNESDSNEKIAKEDNVEKVQVVLPPDNKNEIIPSENNENKTIHSNDNKVDRVGVKNKDEDNSDTEERDNIGEKKHSAPDLGIEVDKATLKSLRLKNIANHFATPTTVKTLAVPPHLLLELRKISLETDIKIKHLTANLLKAAIDNYNKTK